MEKEGRFLFTAVHVIVAAGDEASGFAALVPFITMREGRHPALGDVRLLSEVAARSSLRDACDGA